MTRRNRLLALAALTAFVLFVLVPYYRRGQDSDSGESPQVNDEVGRFKNASAPLSSKLCEGDNCFKGSWKPRQPPFKSIDKLKPWTGCPSTARGNGAMTEAEEKKASARRLLELMNWVWAPADGGSLKPWDPEAFVTRLLRSPGGLIVVGDGTSKDHLEALVVLLNQTETISLTLATQPSQLFRHKYVQQYVLSIKDAAATQRLSELAGVPESRLKRPIVTMIEDSLLINDADLMTISHRLGMKEEQKWTTKLPRVEKWPMLVEELATASSDESSVSEDTILLLNTGIHWSRKELTLLKHRSNPVAEQTYLDEAYRQMLRVVSEQLRPLSSLAVYYRSTTPGHPKCYSRTSPYKSFQQAATMEKNVASRLLQGVTDEEERQDKRKWDWDLFPGHNDLWRRAIVRLEQERKVALNRPYPYTKVFAKWRFLDVWSQALQRPDAHFDPLQDCLSWCSPVLFDQWTQHLHHMLQLEIDEKGSKKKD